MFNKVYELPISKDYVRHWGVVEAVRELIQNAIDSDSPFEYTIGNSYLSIKSRHSSLEPKSLLLGVTSKAETPDKIGQFGEGYKIAMLVLLREGYGMVIRNNGRLWEPEFRYSRTYETEVLAVKDSADEYKEGLEFAIGGLSEQDIQHIKESNLYMQDHFDVKHSTKYGDILDIPGKLYVNGLYITDTGLKYSYDIKPEFIELERDRQTVEDFNLRYRTREMWLEVGDYGEIIPMLENDTPDVSLMQYSCPDLVKEACYKHFRENYPDSIIAKSQKELEELVEQGMTKVVVINSSYGSVVTSSDSYKTQEAVRVPTIEERMQGFMDKHRKHMRRPAIVAFKELLKESKGWKQW